MSERNFIDSGIIEQYVLGLASPDEVAEVQRMAARFRAVQREIEIVEETLLIFAQTQILAPHKSLKTNVLRKISSLELIAQKGWEPINLANPPLLSVDSNYRAWAEAVAHIQLPDDFDDLFLYPIRADERVEQFVAFVKFEVAEEVHLDVLESILLLSGSCECRIWRENEPARIVSLREGDLLELELGEIHDIRITSREPVKAIMQRVAA